MRFPTQKEIIATLAGWAERHSIDNLSGDCYPLFLAVCDRLQIPQKSKDTYLRWLRQGKPQKRPTLKKDSGIGWDHMIALIESLKCYTVQGKKVDLDRFMDGCFVPKLSDVAKIGYTDLEDLPMVVGDETFGRIARVNPKTMKGNRTRIDIMTWFPGMRTEWNAHDGHEFVHVVSGEIHCHFQETLHDEPTLYTLTAGEGIAFPSMLRHEFWNPSKDENALIAVARPTWCTPDQIKA